MENEVDFRPLNLCFSLNFKAIRKIDESISLTRFVNLMKMPICGSTINMNKSQTNNSKVLLASFLPFPNP
jgi:hypothetical protein